MSGRRLELWGLKRTEATRMLDAQLKEMASWGDEEALRERRMQIRRAGYTIVYYRLPTRPGRESRQAMVVYDRA